MNLDTGHQTVTRAATAEADEVLATRGRSFYWARYLLNAQHAARATRLYRFCRHIDDLVDDQVMNQPPYSQARRVYWIMDNGSSHRGAW